MSLDVSHTELFCSFFEVLEQSVFGKKKIPKGTHHFQMHLNFIAGRTYTVYKWSDFSITHLNFSAVCAVTEFHHHLHIYYPSLLLYMSDNYIGIMQNGM